jgi:tetratricopeptide (TPR) repeat protein
MTTKTIIYINCLLFFVSFAIGQGAEGSNSLYNQALKYQAEQNYEKAVSLFTQSIDQEGETENALANLGFCRQQEAKNYLNKAYGNYKKALKTNPKHEETLGYLGELYLLQGNVLKAQGILNNLKDLKSTEAEVLQEKLDNIKAQVNKLDKQ